MIESEDKCDPTCAFSSFLLAVKHRQQRLDNKEFINMNQPSTSFNNNVSSGGDNSNLKKTLLTDLLHFIPGTG